MTHFQFPAGTLALALLFSPGCSGGGGDDGRVPVYETTGKITLAGKSVADAVVTFSPKGEYPVAIGRTDAAGEYQLTTYESGDGAAAGDFDVLVVKDPPRPAGASAPAAHDPHGGASPSGGRNPAAVHAQAAKNAPKSEVPERYGLVGQSGMTATVTKDGENRFDFDLKP